MVALRFDVRDLFRAPRIAFSFQRLWIQFLGLLAAMAGYIVLTYLALVSAGADFGQAWSRFGLLPAASGQPLPWYSKILACLAVLWLAVVLFWTAVAVCRAVYMHLKGNHFYTWKEALRFSLKKKAGASVATPVAIGLIILFTVIGGVVVGLFGRIPWGVGDVLGVGISLLSPVWFAASLFLVFLGLALAVSLLLTPSVLATTDDDAFEGIFQSFSTLAAQPWRIVLYSLLLAALSLIGFGILAWFVKQAWIVMTRVLSAGMGEKYADISYAASYLFQNWVYPAVEWTRAIPASVSNACFFSSDFVGVDLPAIQTVSAVVTAVFLSLFALTVAAYPLAVLNSGLCILFLVLKKKKDDENLLERKDKEEETGEEEKEEAAESEAEPKKAAPRKAARKAARKPARSRAKSSGRTARKK
ncbi:MAG: hypothetical protein QUS35_08325 [bacterium]|nr:hypothetical protein [bacterium]